jgi:cysteine-S-conjugate beta-lyase
VRPDTTLVHPPACAPDSAHAMSPPIYQTATFAQESPLAFGAFDYSRSGNPTRQVLEEQLAILEGGARGFAFASGMAAVAAVVRLLRPGDEVLVSADLYGGTWRLLTTLCPGLAVRAAPTWDLDAVHFRDETRLLLVETPTNPLQRVSDLRALATRAHDCGALLAVDNSLMTPLLQRPLDLGADVVLHSATKFLCGHADVMAGAVVAKTASLAERLYAIQNGEGTALSPFDSWLLLRGTKTLALRLARQQANAHVIAGILRESSAVTEVFWPGFHDHPEAELHARQSRGPGAVVSFTTGDVERSCAIIERLQLFATTVSFGGVTSTASLPCRMSHASIPAADRTLPEDLVRLAVGIEDPEDLTEDLRAALAKVT